MVNDQVSAYIWNNFSCHTQQFSSSFFSSNKRRALPAVRVALTAHFLLMPRPQEQRLSTVVRSGLKTSCPGLTHSSQSPVSRNFTQVQLRCPKSKHVCCIDSCPGRLDDYSKSNAPFACVCEESQDFDQDPDVMIDPTFSNTRTFFFFFF